MLFKVIIFFYLFKAYCFYVLIEGAKAVKFIKEMLRRKGYCYRV